MKLVDLDTAKNLMDDGDYMGALSVYKKIADQYNAGEDAETITKLARAKMGCGLALHYLSELEEAGTFYAEACDLFAKSHNDRLESPFYKEYANSYHNLAKVLDYLQQNEKAITAYEKTIKLLEALHEPEAGNAGNESDRTLANLAFALSSLASIYYLECDRVKDALEIAERAEQVYI